MSEGNETSPSKVTRYQIEIFPNEVRAKYMEFKNLHDIWLDLGVDLDSQDVSDQDPQPDIATDGDENDKAIYGLTPSGFEKMMTLKLELMDYELPPKHKDTEARRAIVLAYLREDIEDHILSFPDITRERLIKRIKMYSNNYIIEDSDQRAIEDAIDSFLKYRKITQDYDIPVDIDGKKKLVKESLGVELPNYATISVEKAIDRLIVRVGNPNGFSLGIDAEEEGVIAGRATLFSYRPDLPPIVLIDHQYDDNGLNQGHIMAHECWHISNQHTRWMRTQLIATGLPRFSLLQTKKKKGRNEKRDVKGRSLG